MPRVREAAVARAAMAAILAQDKGAIPPPNKHEPRRVTAHLGDFRVEAEFPPRSAISMLMVERNGAPVLKAHIEPVWKGGRRSERVDIVDVTGSDWFGDFLALAPAPEAPPERRKWKKHGVAAERRVRRKSPARATTRVRSQSAKPARKKARRRSDKRSRHRDHA